MTSVSSSPSWSPSSSPSSISISPLEFGEVEEVCCEFVRTGIWLGSTTGTLGGNSEGEGRGCWLAKPPKLALVGVFASSRLICAICVLGAVLGLGVSGVSSFRTCGSVLLTALKVAIVSEVWFGYMTEEAGDLRGGEAKE